MRRAFAGDETKEYNKLFVDVVSTLSGKKGAAVSAILERKLLSGGGTTRRWPSDDVVMERALTGSIYLELRTSALRVLLERLELKLRSSKSEDMTVGSGLTIEHILPDKWWEHWPLQGKMIPKEVAAYPTPSRRML